MRAFKTKNMELEDKIKEYYFKNHHDDFLEVFRNHKCDVKYINKLFSYNGKYVAVKYEISSDKVIELEYSFYFDRGNQTFKTIKL